MALKLKILDRVFPWLLILVVLVSCLPVLPVAAEDSVTDPSFLPLRNYYLSSTSGNNVVAHYGLSFTDCSPSYGNAYFNFFDGVFSSDWDSYKRSLSDLAGVYLVADLFSDALSASVLYEFSYSGSASSKYSPAPKFYVSYLDETGAYLSDQSFLGDVKKWPASSSITASLDLVIPENAYYIRFFNDFSHGNITSFSVSLDLSVTYPAGTVPPQGVPEPVPYRVYLDGSSAISADLDATSIPLNIAVYDDYVRLWLDGYEEDYYYRSDYKSSAFQLAGLSLSVEEINDVDYSPGGTYQFELTSSSPSVQLYSLLWSVVHIDPNGGTWNGSSDVSTWSLPEEDGGPLADPVRNGYLFDGWTLTGEGSIDAAPSSAPSGHSYIYTFGYGAGFLTAKWVDDPNAFTTTIVIDGQSFSFPGTVGSPNVQLTIIDTGCILSDGSTTYTWTYNGSGAFSGLSYTEDGEATFAIGITLDCPGGTGIDSSYVLYSSVSGSDAGPYETVIVISGDVFKFSSETEYPLVKVNISSSGLILVYGDQSYQWKPASGLAFLGVAFDLASVEPDYSLNDEYWIVQGSSSKDVFEYYAIYGSSAPGEFSQAQAVFSGFVSFLIKPLMAFFNIEFIPGISFGKISLVAFLFGLVFWFLKASK